jgi:hypothetical protein
MRIQFRLTPCFIYKTIQQILIVSLPKPQTNKA